MLKHPPKNSLFQNFLWSWGTELKPCQTPYQLSYLWDPFQDRNMTHRKVGGMGEKGGGKV